MGLLLIVLLSQNVAYAAEQEPQERLARLETQVDFLAAAVNRVELKLDKLPSAEDSTRHLFSEHGIEGLLALLIMLDKAGYYIRRRNGRKSELPNERP